MYCLSSSVHYHFLNCLVVDLKKDDTTHPDYTPLLFLNRETHTSTATKLRWLESRMKCERVQCQSQPIALSSTPTAQPETPVTPPASQPLPGELGQPDWTWFKRTAWLRRTAAYWDVQFKERAGWGQEGVGWSCQATWKAEISSRLC